jgi:hypothetical protein
MRALCICVFLFTFFTVNAQEKFMEGIWRSTSRMPSATIIANPTVKSNLIKVNSTVLDNSDTRIGVFDESGREIVQMDEGSGLLAEAKKLTISQTGSPNPLTGFWSVPNDRRTTTTKLNWSIQSNLKNKRFDLMKFNSEMEFVLTIDPTRIACSQAWFVVYIDGQPIKSAFGQTQPYASGNSVYGKGKTLQIEMYNGSCSSGAFVNGSLKLYKRNAIWQRQEADENEYLLSGRWRTNSDYSTFPIADQRFSTGEAWVTEVSSFQGVNSDHLIAVNTNESASVLAPRVQTFEGGSTIFYSNDKLYVSQQVKNQESMRGFWRVVNDQRRPSATLNWAMQHRLNNEPKNMMITRFEKRTDMVITIKDLFQGNCTANTVLNIFVDGIAIKDKTGRKNQGFLPGSSTYVKGKEVRIKMVRGSCANRKSLQGTLKIYRPDLR